MAKLAELRAMLDRAQRDYGDDADYRVEVYDELPPAIVIINDDETSTTLMLEDPADALRELAELRAERSRR